MRTNIEIDDELMARAMEAGGFKTKREAVEEGLRMIKRRKAYADLLAARGTLHWDDSDQAWAQARQEALVVREAAPAPYVTKTTARAKPAQTVPAKRGRSK